MAVNAWQTKPSISSEPITSLDLEGGGGVFHVLIDCNSTQERKDYFVVISSIND